MSANKVTKANPVDLVLTNNYSPHNLIHALSEALDISKDYDTDSMVRENLSVRQHTLMVLGQFDNYFSHTKLPLGIGVDKWRILFALHDVLGKPEAIKRGDKTLQHEILREHLPAALKKLGFRAKDIKIAQAVLGNEAIGAYVQNEIDDKKVVEYVDKIVTVAKCSPQEALMSMVMYWMVDAGAYTSDAGTDGNLDFLFEFDRLNRQMKILPPASDKIAGLIIKVSN